MNITLTGSLGHISKPLAATLLQEGHNVTVVSSKSERQKDIEALGAKAAIGVMEDAAFLASAFAGADLVYCMVAGGNFFDPNFDLRKHCRSIAESYVQAIRQAGVNRVIHLSSIGAHTDKGNGILFFHHEVENTLAALPADVSVTTMRPVGFFYNLLGFIPGIKAQGVMVSNYGGDDVVPWVSPIDIAAAVAEEIANPFRGRKVRYVTSEEMSCKEVAGILGSAIGKPDLQWIVIPDEQLEKGMVAAGMNTSVASGLVEMNAAIHSGALFEDYYRNRPEMGKIKIADYAAEFASNFNKQ